MALKDLVSDLSAFKGQTTPDSIDNQIEKGVDFFDNQTGGADGFTPKTDLESLYHKVKEGTIVAPNAGVRPNEKTRNAYGQQGEYSELPGVGLSDPSHVFDSDTILSPVNQPQFTSAFMTTPIADYLSSYDPTQPFSNNLTLTRAVEQHSSTGPTQFTISPFDDTPLYEGAHGSSLLPVQNQFDFTTFRDRVREAETPPFHSSVTAPFTNVALPSPFLEGEYVVEFGSVGGLNTRDRYKDGSIHIMADDIKSPIGGDVVEFASLLPLTGRTSQFSVPEVIGGDNAYITPPGFATYAGQTTQNLPRENFRTTEDGPTVDTFQSEFSVSTLKKTYEDSDYVADLFEFDGGTFQNVPGGLQDGKPFSKTYRELADPNNFDLFRQPFILREVGNNWGLDPIETENPIGSFFGGLANTVDSILGGFVRGAPGFTGLISRSITDKFRIGKFLLTMDGLGFIGKQYVMQGLNPTLESKIYNPLSALSLVGGGDAYNAVYDAIYSSATAQSNISEFARGLGGIVATAALPIGHPERHVGGGRYEDVNPLERVPNFILDKIQDNTIKTVAEGLRFNSSDKGWGSRIAMQSNPELVKEQTLDLGIFGSATIGGRDLGTSMLLMNPNKYLFPVSSAPKSVGKGGISFIGGIGDAKAEAEQIEEKKGGTFNPKTAYNNTENIKRHAALGYADLKQSNRYENFLDSHSERNRLADSIQNSDENFKKNEEAVTNGFIGDPGRIDNNTTFDKLTGVEALRKGGVKSSNVDKVNLLPYGTKDEKIGDQLITDFVKFKFHDMVNNKFIIFRAILDGISDSITPEYGEERYVGRPDKVYVYQGADRSISFGFKVVPKTAQEMPVLMEKLNYLVGMCYPSYTPEERMVTPLMSLTLGDMFNGAMGLLGSLTVTVEDASTWEISDGLQFPHFISCQCEFKYIGNNVLASKGKHYGLKWLPDGSSAPTIVEGAAVNRFTNTSDLGFNDYPNRNNNGSDYRPLYKELGQP